MDRNPLIILYAFIGVLSLSARRAWIEIIAPGTSVFRGWSLSARRAWIEIKGGLLASVSSSVALRKESVDRNPLDNVTDGRPIGRSPQGERG